MCIPLLTWTLQDSNRNLLRCLRNCTTRLLQISWQKHKAACSWEPEASRRQPFWKIYEAGLVLSVWNATQLNGFDIKFQQGQRGAITLQEFLARVEAVAHPGKSSLLKKHRLSSLPLDARRPSMAPSSISLWQRWQMVVIIITVTILVLLPVVAGCATIEFAPQDRSSQLLLPALQTHRSRAQTVPVVHAGQKEESVRGNPRGWGCPGWYRWAGGYRWAGASHACST
jgi:hypothetical protein